MIADNFLYVLESYGDPGYRGTIVERSHKCFVGHNTRCELGVPLGGRRGLGVTPSLQTDLHMF